MMRHRRSREKSKALEFFTILWQNIFLLPTMRMACSKIVEGPFSVEGRIYRLVRISCTQSACIGIYLSESRSTTVVVSHQESSLIIYVLGSIIGSCRKSDSRNFL